MNIKFYNIGPRCQCCKTFFVDTYYGLKQSEGCVLGNIFDYQPTNSTVIHHKVGSAKLYKQILGYPENLAWDNT
jgi:hypothetical protein